MYLVILQPSTAFKKFPFNSTKTFALSPKLYSSWLDVFFVILKLTELSYLLWTFHFLQIIFSWSIHCLIDKLKPFLLQLSYWKLYRDTCIVSQGCIRICIVLRVICIVHSLATNRKGLRPNCWFKCKLWSL